MKTHLTMLLVVLMVLALAAPVGAAKPDRPGKPGKSGPVDFTIDANLFWVNAAGDTIYYTIELASSEDIDGAVVELSVNGTVEILFDGDFAAGKSLSLEYSYVVADLPDNDIEALATVRADGEAMASDTTSTSVEPVDECGFDGTRTSLSMMHPGGACRYDFAPGYWKIVAEPDYPNASRNPSMTMRDHVPGNWCMYGETEQEGGSKTRPASITRYADLLTENPFGYGDWFEAGVCGLGGHGVCTDENCFFPTGNPASFVLVAPAGTVTATRLGDAPSPTP